MSRRDYEAALRDWLGIETVVWLPFGLVEDSGPLSTSGHVDDVAQFIAPGVVLAQTAPHDNPNHARLLENLEVLKGARDAAGRPLRVVEIEVLPYVTGVGAGLDVSAPGAGKLMPAPYVNLVFVNGGVLLPRLGAQGEEDVRRLIGDLLPGREVVGLPVEMSAFGGGGLGCITQQVPSGSLRLGACRRQGLAGGRIVVAREVTLAATQMSCGREVEDNVAKAERLVRRAAELGADIVLLQELFETPYFPIDQDAGRFALARPLAGHPTVDRLAASPQSSVWCSR